MASARSEALAAATYPCCLVKPVCVVGSLPLPKSSVRDGAGLLYNVVDAGDGGMRSCVAADEGGDRPSPGAKKGLVEAVLGVAPALGAPPRWVGEEKLLRPSWWGDCGADLRVEPAAIAVAIPPRPLETVAVVGGGVAPDDGEDDV